MNHAGVATLPNSRVGQADTPGLPMPWSIEVMPRTAGRIENFRSLLPAGTRVYVAHIADTPIEDMVETARRLRDDGFPVMPHFPARAITGRRQLEEWIRRYRDEAGVDQALLLGGNNAEPAGDLTSSIDLLETGLFDRYGFTRLHVAGHPEGNRDIDRKGGFSLVDGALRTKQDYADRTDADMAIVTQFAFEARAVTTWAERIADLGITLPIHVGTAGPTRLQTLIRFALACGVGPSLSVLHKRALDLGKLLLPYEPTDVVADFTAYKARRPQSLITQLHMFPLGGIIPAVERMNAHNSGMPALATH